MKEGRKVHIFMCVHIWECVWGTGKVLVIRKLLTFKTSSKLVGTFAFTHVKYPPPSNITQHSRASYLLCSKWTVFNHSLQYSPTDRGLGSKPNLMSASTLCKPSPSTKLASLSSPGLPGSRVSTGKRRPKCICNSSLTELTAPAATTKPRAWTAS